MPYVLSKANLTTVFDFLVTSRSFIICNVEIFVIRQWKQRQLLFVGIFRRKHSDRCRRWLPQSQEIFLGIRGESGKDKRNILNPRPHRPYFRRFGTCHIPLDSCLCHRNRSPKNKYKFQNTQKATQKPCKAYTKTATCEDWCFHR